MGSEKLKIARTDLDNLVSNLRGEVGEVITTWLLMRNFMGLAARVGTGDVEKDVNNRELHLLGLMVDKLLDELTARLSELAEKKVGQLTFYFATQKIGKYKEMTEGFEEFIVKNRIRDKRNQDISHKQLPEQWTGHRSINIPYQVIIHAVAMAVRLMKRIDREVLGPQAPYAWREARKRRYNFMSPPRAGYGLLPFLNLKPTDRIQIMMQELNEGAEVWSEMDTTINGKPAKVRACKKWGIVLIGDRLLALNQYPLVELAAMDSKPAEKKED